MCMSPPSLARCMALTLKIKYGDHDIVKIYYLRHKDDHTRTHTDTAMVIQDEE